MKGRSWDYRRVTYLLLQLRMGVGHSGHERGWGRHNEEEQISQGQCVRRKDKEIVEFKKGWNPVTWSTRKVGFTMSVGELFRPKDNWDSRLELTSEKSLWKGLWEDRCWWGIEQTKEVPRKYYKKRMTNNNQRGVGMGRYTQRAPGPGDHRTSRREIVVPVVE